MQHFFRFIHIILLVCALGCAPSARAFEQPCADHYESCLASLQKQVELTDSKAKAAYLGLKIATLHVIFGRYSVAEPLLSGFINHPDLTEHQRIEAVIYHGKNYSAMGDRQMGQFYSQEAERRIVQLGLENLDWDMLVEYSNVLIYNNKLKESYAVLEGLEGRSHSGVSPRILADMYTNLSHLAIRLDRNQLLLDYTRKAYHYTLKLDNAQQSGVAAHNLARALTLGHDLQEAIKMFSGRRIGFSVAAGDLSTANYSRYRMADAYLQLGVSTRSPETWCCNCSKRLSRTMPW